MVVSKYHFFGRERERVVFACIIIIVLCEKSEPTIPYAFFVIGGALGERRGGQAYEIFVCLCVGCWREGVKKNE